ncbi:uncharacterized protein LOC106014158, partial [Aplysia californica]|uniref:Uncharacterized protein LOC106014158 n=1 Tax=Aplysia californica TaxID=6500 RepID=A0ABM1AFL2_APLCA
MTSDDDPIVSRAGSTREEQETAASHQRQAPSPVVRSRSRPAGTMTWEWREQLMTCYSTMTWVSLGRVRSENVVGTCPADVVVSMDIPHDSTSTVISHNTCTNIPRDLTSTDTPRDTCTDTPRDTCTDTPRDTCTDTPRDSAPLTDDHKEGLPLSDDHKEGVPAPQVRADVSRRTLASPGDQDDGGLLLLLPPPASDLSDRCDVTRPVTSVPYGPSVQPTRPEVTPQQGDLTHRPHLCNRLCDLDISSLCDLDIFSLCDLDIFSLCDLDIPAPCDLDISSMRDLDIPPLCDLDIFSLCDLDIPTLCDLDISSMRDLHLPTLTPAQDTKPPKTGTVPQCSNMTQKPRPPPLTTPARPTSQQSAPMAAPTSVWDTHLVCVGQPVFLIFFRIKSDVFCVKRPEADTDERLGRHCHLQLPVLPCPSDADHSPPRAVRGDGSVSTCVVCESPPDSVSTSGAHGSPPGSVSTCVVCESPPGSVSTCVVCESPPGSVSTCVVCESPLVSLTSRHGHLRSTVSCVHSHSRYHTNNTEVSGTEDLCSIPHGPVVVCIPHGPVVVCIPHGPVVVCVYSSVAGSQTLSSSPGEQSPSVHFHTAPTRSPQPASLFCPDCQVWDIATSSITHHGTPTAPPTVPPPGRVSQTHVLTPPTQVLTPPTHALTPPTQVLTPPTHVSTCAMDVGDVTPWPRLLSLLAVLCVAPRPRPSPLAPPPARRLGVAHVCLLLMALTHVWPGVLLTHAQGLSGTVSRCDKEGEEIAISGITDDPCISCVCKDGLVQCETKQCARLEGCHAILFDHPSGRCCEMCKGCRYKGAQYSSGDSWLDKSDPCLRLSCRAGVVSRSRARCFSHCHSTVVVEGMCCPVCAGCYFRGHTYQ